MAYVSVAVFGAVVLVVLAMPTAGRITVSCAGYFTPRVTCTIGNWTVEGVDPGTDVRGSQIDLNAYFSSLVQVTFNCTGNQLISPTSLEGFKTCNATIDPVTGRTYAVPASPLDPSVIENRHCLTNKVEETLSFAPSNDTLESHYIINTIVNGSVSSLNNHVGGACLRGVKIQIHIYRENEPTVAPSANATSGNPASSTEPTVAPSATSGNPGPASGTAPTASTGAPIGRTTSSAMSLIQYNSALYVAVLLLLVLLVDTGSL